MLQTDRCSGHVLTLQMRQPSARHPAQIPTRESSCRSVARFTTDSQNEVGHPRPSSIRPTSPRRVANFGAGGKRFSATCSWAADERSAHDEASPLNAQEFAEAFSSHRFEETFGSSTTSAGSSQVATIEGKSTVIAPCQRSLAELADVARMEVARFVSVAVPALRPLARSRATSPGRLHDDCVLPLT